MILFKQFLYRVVQGALDPEESTLFVFGKDGDRDCAFPHRYNPFIDGPADDLGDCLADPGQFFGEQFFDGIEILETDADLERIPGIHTGHIDDILDIPVADDLDVASGSFQLGRPHADLQHLSAVAAHIDNISDLVFSLKYNRQTGDDVRDQILGAEGYRKRAQPKGRKKRTWFEPEIEEGKVDEEDDSDIARQVDKTVQ